MNYLPLKLEKLRKHYNYSQSYLADVLGIDVIEYMGYENGRSMISYAQAKKLASLYHINIIEIFKNDDNVTLYEVNEAKTDELNIAYFLPKKTLLTRLKEHPFLAGGTLGLVVAAIILVTTILNSNNRPYVSYADNTDRLAVSNTSVIYIDNVGAVKGSGDNANGQISNLPSENAIKVAEGENFSVVLCNDGTVQMFGALEAYQKEISKWKNIQDIACGKGHIVGVNSKGDVLAVGDNSKGQCDVENFKDIKNVYATNTGTICVDKEGNIYYSGSFIGTSTLKRETNILDVDSSDDNLIILKEDGTCDYVASYENTVYQEITKWKDIVDVECGDEFFAGLKSDGTVLVASKNEKLKNNWKSILAIAAGNDYLIGFDGKNIYGVGKNTYNQFVDETNSNSQVLPQVKKITVDYDNDNVYVTFDAVTNAKSYEVTLFIDSNTKETKTVDKNTEVIFETNRLKDNNAYEIGVKAMGDSTYEDSIINYVQFVFLREVEENTVDEEEKITINPMIVNSTRERFEEYLIELGVDKQKINGTVDETKNCEGSAEMLVEITGGITPGSTYSKSELYDRNITYTYCKINWENEENDN